MSENTALAPRFVNISEAYNLFHLRCRAERFQPSTLKFYGWTLQPFFAWCEAQSVTQLGDITAHHIRAYLVEKQTSKRGNPTSGNYLHTIARSLRAFFRYCVADELLTQSPMIGVKMPRRPKKILDAFNIADARRLIQAADNDRDKAPVYFLLDTGIRLASASASKLPI